MTHLRINLTTCAPAALISHQPTGRGEPQSFITRSPYGLARYPDPDAHRGGWIVDAT
jgi:hypothetical protein